MSLAHQSTAQNASTGWRAALRLRFASRNGQTRLVERHHLGPLVVQRPFYPEPNACHAYIVHPPGGVVGGDDLSMEVSIEPGAHALLTTPAAGKFYRSEGAFAQLSQCFRVDNGAHFEWLPQESIYYRGANVRSQSNIALAPNARFIGWEVTCLGLPARGEIFDQGRLRLGLELSVGETPRWVDRLRIEAGSTARAALCGLAGHTAIGTLLAYPGRAELLDALRDISEPNTQLAATLVDEVIMCRVLANQGEPVRRALVQCWSVLRPAIIERPALLPRIWAT